MKSVGISLCLVACVVVAFFIAWDRADEEDWWARRRHAAPPPPETAHSRLLASRGDSYVLEIRGAAFGVQGDAARHIWRRISETASKERSFLLDDPTAFPSDQETVSLYYNAIWKSVFRTAASKAVEYWPIPTFILRGPQPSGRTGRPADGILDGLNGAGLGVTMALWQDDEVAASTQAMIGRLFALFDENNDVPEALIVASDGDEERKKWSLERWVGVPSVLNSHSALLLSRSDRVEALVRPHALLKMGDVSPRDMQSNPARFLRFFWNRSDSQTPDAFDAYYKAKMAREGHGDVMAPGTMSTEWWLTQLPAFWEQVRDDRSYKPTPFLPVRWTGGQLKKFDSSPLFGYLHRPIRVRLHDQKGTLLDDAAAVTAIREGWNRALEALPADGKPTRIFYDTSGRPRWETVLATALREAPYPLDVADEQVGYDMNKRLGDTGAVSALGQIALATVASHGDGRVTATINLGTDGDADIVIVTPADAAQREKNLHGPDSYDLFGQAD